MSMSFNKFHGLGNDYLVYDIKKNKRELSTKEIKRICNRNFGFGSDGILVGPYMHGDKYGVKILLSSQCKETAAFCEYPIDLTDTMDETEEVKNMQFFHENCGKHLTKRCIHSINIPSL